MALHIISHTAEMICSFYFVLAIYFLAYSIVPLFATFGFLGLMPEVFPRIYWELNSQWYQDVGYLVTWIMVYNIIMPPVTFAFLWLL